MNHCNDCEFYQIRQVGAWMWIRVCHAEPHDPNFPKKKMVRVLRKDEDGCDKFQPKED